MRVAELCPLTLRGALVLGASGLALYVYGFGELDGVWYVAGLGMSALSVLSLFLVLAAALRLKLWLRNAALSARPPEGGRRSSARPPDGGLRLHEPSAVDTGREFGSAFSVPRLHFWLFVEVGRQRWIQQWRRC
jgi:hypothetical protein